MGRQTRTRHVLGCLVILGCVVFGVEVSGAAASDETAARVAPSTVVASIGTKSGGCTKRAPNSAVGYAAMFRALPATLWAGGDLSLSVPLPDGRSVWLYGDTFSTGRMVHSSAVTQDRGCVHVSHDGAQLLPNDDADDVYWIAAARVTGSAQLTITAQRVHLTGKNIFDFEPGTFRAAVAAVGRNGDLTFQRWLPGSPAPPVRGSTYDDWPFDDIVTVQGKRLTVSRHRSPAQYFYSPYVHPEASLASGGLLVSIAQNWGDGVLHPPAEYCPIFTEVS
jgi:hypothetical protein